MSLRRHSNKYNRMEEKEEFYWLIFFHDSYNPYEWNYYDEYGAWGDWFDYAGSVRSMDEYHKMKMLTLLHQLAIRKAKDEAQNRGW